MHRYRDFANKDPWTYYEHLIDRGPTWDSDMNAWLVADFETCAHVLQREEVFERADQYQPGGPEARGNTRNLVTMTGKEQVRLHRYILSFIDERRSAVYRGTIVRPTIDRLIDEMLTRPGAELADQYCVRLPTLVGMAQVGLDPNDEDLERELTRLNMEFSLWQESFGTSPSDNLASARAVAQIRDLIMPFVRAKRGSADDDIASLIWQTGHTIYADWNDEDSFSAIFTYLRGGETKFALRNVLYVLATSPDLVDGLRADPASRPRFVEECMRYHGVVHWAMRKATRDVELNGAAIKEGDQVVAVTAAAGRDPARYSDARTFNHEEVRKPHLALGFGPRYCPGQALARVELQETVSAMVERVPKMHLDPGEAEPRFTQSRIRTFEPLYVRWDGGGE